MLYIILTLILALLLFSIHNMRKTVTLLYDVRHFNRLAFRGAEYYYIKSPQELPRHPEALTTPGRHAFDTEETVDGKSTYQRCRYIVRDNGSILGYIQDITAEHELQRALANTLHTSDEAKQKDTFLQRLNREIRTPLSVITNACDTLTNGKPDAATRSQLIQDIQHNSTSLTKLINDILQFSRIESGRMKYNFQPLHISTFCNEYFESSKNLIPTGVNFHLCPGRDDIVSNTDADRLRDILQQFLDNAIRYTSLKLSSEDTGKGTPPSEESGSGVVSPPEILFGWKYLLGKGVVQIYVEDSGDGIEEQLVRDIFDVFWRDTSFTSGVGIGLTIAKELSQALGGHISAKSQHHKGSRFSVWVPAKVQEPTNPPLYH